MSLTPGPLAPVRRKTSPRPPGPSATRFLLPPNVSNDDPSRTSRHRKTKEWSNFSINGGAIPTSYRSVDRPGVGDLCGVLPPEHGGLIVRLQHVQGAESEGRDGVQGGTATRELVRDDVARREGRRVDGPTPGILERERDSQTSTQETD